MGKEEIRTAIKVDRNKDAGTQDCIHVRYLSAQCNVPWLTTL